MRYGFIADIHLNISDNLSPINSATGLSYRTHDKLKGIVEALQICVDEECEAFFLLGDIYDKLNPSEKLKEAFLQCLLLFQDKIKIYIIPGNHDSTNYTNNYLTENIIFNSMNKPFFKVILSPQIEYFNGGRDKFLLMPWNVDHKSIKDFIDKVEEGLIFLGHLEIQGAISSTDFTLTSGLHPGIFQKFKMVFLGHYHKRQRPAQNILYVGSSSVKDFSEVNDIKEKGFIIYETLSNNIKSYRLEPRGFKFYLLTKDNLDFIQKSIDDDPPSEGSIIKLRFTGTKEWVSEIIPGAIKIFQEFKPMKIIKEKIYETTREKRVHSVLEKFNRLDRIKELAKDQNEELVSLGISIYQKAVDEYLEVKI